jgi:hypothetical protein
MHVQCHHQIHSHMFVSKRLCVGECAENSGQPHYEAVPDGRRREFRQELRQACMKLGAAHHEAVPDGRRREFGQELDAGARHMGRVHCHDGPVDVVQRQRMQQPAVQGLGFAQRAWPHALGRVSALLAAERAAVEWRVGLLQRRMLKNSLGAGGQCACQRAPPEGLRELASRVSLLSSV